VWECYAEVSRYQPQQSDNLTHMKYFVKSSHVVFPVFVLVMLGFSNHTLGHGGRLNKEGCHNNRSISEYHCHQGTAAKSQKKPSNSVQTNSENYFNDLLAKRLSGRREVRLAYSLGASNASNYVIVDIETNRYVIEGGLDKRSSLDSIQQALFAAAITGKEPAVAIYDTDKRWGKYEHRIWTAANKIGLKFIWFNGEEIIEK